MRDLAAARFCPFCGGGLARRRPDGDPRERLVCAACGFVLYVGLKVAAGTLPLLDGRLLLVRRGVPPGKGLWSFPCGFAEADETLEQCAVRETREEAGVVVRLAGLLGAYSYPPAVDAGGRVAVLAYAAEVVDGTPVAGDDATEVGLFAPREIPWRELAFPSSRDALRAWLATPGRGSAGGTCPPRASGPPGRGPGPG